MVLFRIPNRGSWFFANAFDLDELGLFIGGLAVWQSVKVIEKSEEQDEDGTLTIRERERFSNVLTIAYEAGKVAVSK